MVSKIEFQSGKKILDLGRFIDSGFHHLKYCGSMVMVTKRYKWYKNKLKSVFSGVKVIAENVYYIFISQKETELSEKDME